MSKRPPQKYLDELPGRHMAVYRGRDLAGFIVIRDGETLAYEPRGSLVASYLSDAAGLVAAREELFSGQWGRPS